MKRILIIGIVLLLLVVGVSWYYYEKQLPKVVAKAIIKNKYPVYIPEKIQGKIVKVSDTLNAKVENFLVTTDTIGISINEILKIIDEVKEEDVRKTISIIQNQDIKSVEEVFDIAVENIPIKSFNVELLREPFINNIKINHINRALGYLRTHNILELIDPEIARETIKQVIIQKEDELKSRGILKN
ncbi:MAG: hypothetical protein AAF363_14610 [Bacteroidota bacterium]